MRVEGGRERGARAHNGCNCAPGCSIRCIPASRDSRTRECKLKRMALHPGPPLAPGVRPRSALAPAPRLALLPEPDTTESISHAFPQNGVHKRLKSAKTRDLPTLLRVSTTVDN